GVAHRSPGRRPSCVGKEDQSPVSSPDRKPCGRQGPEALLDELIQAEHDRGAGPPVRKERPESPALFLPIVPIASPDGYNPASSCRATARSARRPSPPPAGGHPCASEDRSDRSPHGLCERRLQQRRPVPRQSSRQSDGGPDPSCGPTARLPEQIPPHSPGHAPSSGFAPH